jgi:hypothetical protein
VTTTEWVEVEDLAKLLCEAFSRDRGYSWDSGWENVGEATRGAWRTAAKAALSYVRSLPAR